MIDPMQRTLIAVIAAPLFAFTVAGTNWKLDNAHANLRFSITHLGINEVEGAFKIFNSSITATKDDLSDATVEFSADAKSIDTGNERRDGHLRSADFFDVEKYPSLTFKSTSFTKVSEGRYKVKGDLTMHGVTKPVELDATARFATHPRSNKPMVNFKVSGTIDRTQFGVGESSALGRATVSDEVSFTANLPYTQE